MSPPSPHGPRGRQVVYIDTEGTFRPERLRQIAEAKGVSAEAAMENIIYAAEHDGRSGRWGGEGRGRDMAGWLFRPGRSWFLEGQGVERVASCS